jgi:hydrogenase expression/formation protein HypE
MDTLRRVIDSMAAAARAVGVQIVTGDTKVVDQGKGDGLYINTAGIGVIADGVDIAPTNIRPGDSILLNGDLGRHSLAIMALREGLRFESEIESDCAPLVEPVMALLDAGIKVRCLRDLTRGGLASALVEIASTAGRDLQIAESAVPVRDDVRGACEILGLDPLYAANEGRFITFVAPEDAPRALALLGEGAQQIGSVLETQGGQVTLISVIGAARVIDMLSGEQLPRIC